MKFIDPVISFSTIKHPRERTIFGLGFKKWLKEKSHLIEIKYFLILAKTVSFLVTLMHILVKCSSNFNSLAIVIPNSSTVLFSHVILSLTLTHICSNLLPEINKWHFSAFIFISLISNHSIASAVYSSSFSGTYSKLELQT